MKSKKNSPMASDLNSDDREIMHELMMMSLHALILRAGGSVNIPYAELTTARDQMDGLQMEANLPEGGVTLTSIDAKTVRAFAESVFSERH